MPSSDEAAPAPERAQASETLQELADVEARLAELRLKAEANHVWGLDENPPAEIPEGEDTWESYVQKRTEGVHAAGRSDAVYDEDGKLRDTLSGRFTSIDDRRAEHKDSTFRPVFEAQEPVDTNKKELGVFALAKMAADARLRNDSWSVDEVESQAAGRIMDVVKAENDERTAKGERPMSAQEMQERVARDLAAFEERIASIEARLAKKRGITLETGSDLTSEPGAKPTESGPQPTIPNLAEMMSSAPAPTADMLQAPAAVSPDILRAPDADLDTLRAEQGTRAQEEAARVEQYITQNGMSEQDAAQFRANANASFERRRAVELERGRLFPDHESFTRFQALTTYLGAIEPGFDSGYEQGQIVRVGDQQEEWTFLGLTEGGKVLLGRKEGAASVYLDSLTPAELQQANTPAPAEAGTDVRRAASPERETKEQRAKIEEWWKQNAKYYGQGYLGRLWRETAHNVINTGVKEDMTPEVAQATREKNRRRLQLGLTLSMVALPFFMPLVLHIGRTNGFNKPDISESERRFDTKKRPEYFSPKDQTAEDFVRAIGIDPAIWRAKSPEIARDFSFDFTLDPRTNGAIPREGMKSSRFIQYIENLKRTANTGNGEVA